MMEAAKIQKVHVELGQVLSFKCMKCAKEFPAQVVPRKIVRCPACDSVAVAYYGVAVTYQTPDRQRRIKRDISLRS
jgi:NAD-dependent SIR2 family protein deacetylase